MGRPLRSDSDGGWHHVMNRGAARQPTFLSNRDRVEFERLLGVGYQRLGVEIHAYFMMSNHFHLLVRCPQGGLSEYRQRLSSVFTRHHNERVGRDGPLCRGRFHAIPIHTDDYRLHAARYIHRNPLDIDASQPLDRYRWSSHRVYLGHRRRPDWMRTDVILGWFNGDTAAFDRFVVGDAMDPDSALRRTADTTELAAVVELVIDESDPPLARQGLGRTVSLLVADQINDGDATTLADQFGYRDERAVKDAVWRARRRASAEPMIGTLTDRALRLVA